MDRIPAGAGLGLRLAFAEELLGRPDAAVDFVEIAPENYLGCGGRRARVLDAAAERWPVTVHGLAADLAGADPLDGAALEALRTLLRRVRAPFYSDHLALTRARGAALHDLLPLPFTRATAERAARRVRAVRARLELPVAIENVSSYVRWPEAELGEAEFVAAVVREAGCSLLLDVNNVHVNAVNLGLDPHAYLAALPLERVVEVHVAGHERRAGGLLLDTHGEAVDEAVWRLLDEALGRIGRPVPVLLERDHRHPPLAVLLDEVARIRKVQEGRRAA